MPKLAVSSKRALIDKANTTVVVVTSIAAFVFVFSMVATKTLVSQAAYQNRIISAKRKAVDQLKSDISASGDLKASYDAFTHTTQNVLGGDPNGSGSQDGNNAKIVLDALPSSYDFPAMTTSLEKLLNNANVSIGSITGTDDEAAQSANTSSTSPSPVAMPFQVSVTGNYKDIQTLIDEFQRSIRPIQIQSMQISGSQANLSMSVSAQTFYQPAKSLNIKSEVVK